MLLQTVVFALGKRVATFMVGGVVLWQVATHAGPMDCTAIVHVAVPNVDLLVDDAPYHVGDLTQSPVVCPLRAGTHTMQLMQGDIVLYEQEFEVVAGREVILAAWDQQLDGPSDPR